MNNSERNISNDQSNAIETNVLGNEGFPCGDDLLGRAKGCLIGGAAGDALGYAIEFDNLDSIRNAFGKQGIQTYELSGPRGQALVSDDTQMTLFTAVGLVSAAEAGATTIEGISEHLRYAYLDWLSTQNPRYAKNPRTSWLLKVPELHDTRAPGNTCLTALQRGGHGSIDDPINESKGCGGVMRVAPMGIAIRDPRKAAMVAAQGAAITHGHPLGFIPAAALAFIVNRCLAVPQNAASKQDALRGIVEECCYELSDWFPTLEWSAGKQVAILKRAVELALNENDDTANIRKLGEGWVGEEALAIAVYGAVRYADDFSSAIRCAVNHSGDSDSTGAVCGNILGALLGIDAIDSSWVQDLELSEVIMKVAEDLCQVRGNATE